MRHAGFVQCDTLEQSEIRALRSEIAKRDFEIMNLKNKIFELELMIKTRTVRKIIEAGKPQ